MKPLMMLTLALGLALSAAPTADAAWSAKNPYKSYNITGLNYGSQQWEKQYGNRSGRTYARPRWRR